MKLKNSTLTCLFATVALSACIHAEPPHAPLPRVDAEELFRRARFAELSQLGGGAMQHVRDRLRPRTVSPEVDALDEQARESYRRGDASAAARAIEKLPSKHRTKIVLSALLSRVDASAPIFARHIDAPTISIPVDRAALSAGYVVIPVEVGNGKRLRMLLDTGSTENVLSDQAATALGLDLREVSFTNQRTDDALVVRFAAAGLRRMDIEGWSVSNVPVIVTELETVHGLDGIDGFLSPQLLLRDGCFAIDGVASRLRVAFDATTCHGWTRNATGHAPLFIWDGEVYVSGRIAASPEVGLRLETGSSVTYLSADASRYMPKGAIRETPDQREGEIAHDLTKTVKVVVAGQALPVSVLDLDPRRRTEGYDDVGAVGSDLLFSSDGLVVSFATLELGFLPTNAMAEL